MDRLADVAAAAAGFAARQRGGCSGLVGPTTKLRLPLSVQARLDLAEEYEADAGRTASAADQLAMRRAAQAARCGAARELIAMGVAVEDVGALLDVSPEQIRALVTWNVEVVLGDG